MRRVAEKAVAAQSGAIGAEEETWMEATVIGPGTLSFRYELEYATDASLSLCVDGGFFWSSSSGSWSASGPHSISSGTHTLRWRYAKGSGGSSAGRAWRSGDTIRNSVRDVVDD